MMSVPVTASGAKASAPISSANSSVSAAPPITTFSIVAYDPESNEYGIAVQSKFFSVGSVAQCETDPIRWNSEPSVVICGYEAVVSF